MVIARVPVAHRSPVYALGTAREADGRWRIFTVGDDRRIRGWDAPIRTIARRRRDDRGHR
jgi:hypothetical protein